MSTYSDTSSAVVGSTPTRRLLMVNGEKFRIIEQGEGPAVLFCHGFPDTAETWLSQLNAVANGGFRAIALDMRGFGESYAPTDVNLYTSIHVAGDLVGVLDGLEIADAVLVGHDWGADYAQRAAIMRPDRFKAVVSVSIPFSPRGELSLWDDLTNRNLDELYYSLSMIHEGADRLFQPAHEAIPGILYWLSSSPPPDERWDPIDPARSMLRPAPAAMPDWVDPEYLRRTVESFERSGFDTGLNYYRAVQKSFDLTAAYKGAILQQPALYIWGADDGLCRFFHTATPSFEDFRKVQPSLVRHVRLENTGHWVQHEAAKALNEELLKFLGDLQNESGSEK